MFPSYWDGDGVDDDLELLRSMPTLSIGVGVRNPAAGQHGMLSTIRVRERRMPSLHVPPEMEVPPPLSALTLLCIAY